MRVSITRSTLVRIASPFGCAGSVGLAATSSMASSSASARHRSISRWAREVESAPVDGAESGALGAGCGAVAGVSTELSAAAAAEAAVASAAASAAAAVAVRASAPVAACAVSPGGKSTGSGAVLPRSASGWVEAAGCT